MPTLMDYRRLLDVFLGLDRTIGGFLDPVGGCRLLLRLDIDYDPALAEITARINRERSIRATYFVHLGSSLYNPAAPEGRRLFETLAECGQGVGLHHAIKDEPLDEGRLLAEFAALKALYPAAEQVVSWHNPAGNFDEANRRAARLGFVSAYAPRFFGPDRYVSDSNLRHSGDEIAAFVTACRAPVVQALLHPLNWCLDAHSMEGNPCGDVPAGGWQNRPRVR